VEYNCRFGDPETQVVLPIWQGDLYRLFRSVARGNLDRDLDAVNSVGTAVCVVMASGGYPGSYEKGKPISGLDHLPEDIIAFHAGTAIQDGSVVTAGGRVIGVTALSDSADLAATVHRAYEGVQEIAFEGSTWRRDIGARAVGTTHSESDNNASDA
jgi:phosphoribosylamine--glycine ligase